MSKSGQFLQRVVIWLAMLLAPQACLLAAWFGLRFAAQPNLLGGVQALRELASDLQGIRSALWWLGLCGVVGAALSAWTAFKPPSLSAQRLRRGLVPLLCLVTLFRAHSTGEPMALPGALAGVLVLVGLMVADFRLWSALPPLTALPRPTKHSLLIYAGTLALTLPLCLPTVLWLGAPGYDEAFSLLQYASLGPVVSLLRYDYPNNHLAYNVVVSTLLPNGGANLLVARLVSLSWFIALLATAGSLARALAGRQAQLITVACLLLHGSVFPLGCTGRGYTMAMCLGTLGWLLLIREERATGRPYAKFCFLAATATVPSWAILFGVAMLADWHESRSVRALRSWLVYVAAAILWYLPAGAFLSSIWGQSWLGAQSAVPVDVAGALSRSLAFLVGWRVADLATYWPFLALLGLCVAAGATASRSNSQRFALLNLLGLAVVTLVYTLHEVPPVLRQALVFVPFYAVLVGAGAARLLAPVPTTWRSIATGVVCLALLVGSPAIGSVELRPRESSQSITRVAQLVGSEVGPEDLVHASAPDSAILVYLLGADRSFHALDLVLARLRWRDAEGDIWMVVRTGRSTLDQQLARLKGYPSTEALFAPPQLVLETASHAVYRLSRIPPSKQ